MSYPGPPHPPSDPEPGYGPNNPPPYQAPPPLYAEHYQQPPAYQQPTYQQPHYGPQPPAAPAAPATRTDGQSRGGIAGVVCFVLTLLTYALLFVIAIVNESEIQPDAATSTPTEVAVIVLALLGMGLNLIGLVASLVGLAERDRSKMLCWVGFGLNMLPCLGCGGLIGIALAAAAGGG